MLAGAAWGLGITTVALYFTYKMATVPPDPVFREEDYTAQHDDQDD